MRAADDHLRGITADGETEPSFARARDLVLGAGYDLLGVEHAEAAEFRDDKLAQLETAQQLRRAIAIARRFARPSREDYLVCTRGFPLPRWRELRRHVLERAVAWGLWMGPELAQVAVSEGLARSRRDLIAQARSRLRGAARGTRRRSTSTPTPPTTTRRRSPRRRGRSASSCARARRNGAIASDEVPHGVGLDRRARRRAARRAKRSIDELIALLDDKQQRVAAATRAVRARRSARRRAGDRRRGQKMSRAEAVRVLGMSVKFGRRRARRRCIEGLASSKAFLRHGCALALALLRTEDGTQAVIELLMTEPTEIWREIARAIGQIGPTALMPLASTFGRLGDQATPALAERVAWAMAHVGGARRQGGRRARWRAGRASWRRSRGRRSSSTRRRPAIRSGSDPGPTARGRDAMSRSIARSRGGSSRRSSRDCPRWRQAGLDDLEAASPPELLDEADPRSKRTTRPSSTNPISSRADRSDPARDPRRTCSGIDFGYDRFGCT